MPYEISELHSSSKPFDQILQYPTGTQNLVFACLLDLKKLAYHTSIMCDVVPFRDTPLQERESEKTIWASTRRPK